MTSVDGPTQALPPPAQPAGRGLAVGQKLVVNVVAATRQGIAVLIGDNAVDLKGPSRLAEAKTLTLQVTTRPSASGQDVDVLEADGQPLSTSIKGQLVEKSSTASQPVTSTIVQKGQFDVTAKPVSPDGKAVGPLVQIRLQAQSIDSAPKLLPAVIPSASGNLLENARQTLAPANANQARPTPVNAGQSLHVSQPFANTEPSPSPSPTKPALPAQHQTTQPSPPNPALTIQNQPTQSLDGETAKSVVETPQNGKPPAGIQPETDIELSAKTGKVLAQSTLPQGSNASDVGRTRPSIAETPSEPRGPNVQPLQSHAAVRPPIGSPSTLPTEPPIGGNSFTKIASKGEAILGDLSQRFEKASRSLTQAIATPSTPVSTNERPSGMSVDKGSFGTRDGRVPAIVVARSTTGDVILRTSEHLLKIEQPIDLPLDATLSISFPAGPPSLLMEETAINAAVRETPLAKLIELLDDIDKASRLADGRGDTLVSPRQLPTSDGQLAARLLSLLASLDGKPFDEKLTSKRDRGDQSSSPADQIKSLMNKIGAQSSEALAEGWRSTMLPLGSDPAQAIFLFHRDHDLDADDEGAELGGSEEKAKRAVFDVSLSKLGRCQIDALCQEHRFDLIVRSENTLPDNEQQEIAAIFVCACEIAGLQGEIGFRVGQFFEPPRSSKPPTDVRT